MLPPKEYLKKIKPFSFLTNSELSRLVEGIEVVFFSAGSSICRIGEICSHVYLLFSGLIALYEDDDRVLDFVSRGELFCLISALHQAPSYYEARAIENSICYAIDRDTFAKIYHSHRDFADFFASFIERRFRAFSELVEQTETSFDPLALTPVRAILTKSPVTCGPDTPVQEAVRTMETHKVGSIIISNHSGKPLGIFTNRDMRRMIMRGRVEGKVSEFMSSPVIRVDQDVPVLEAYSTLIRTGIDHLVVVEGEKVVGVVTSKDILAQIEPSSSLLTIYRKVIKSTDIKTLSIAFKSIAHAAAQMALKGVPFYHLSPLLTSIYDTVTAKVIELNISKATSNDFLWIHVGSSGRKEQVLTTDQDNIFMYGSSGPQLLFAESVNNDLNRIGISKCPAGYMASNPLWHLSVEEWKKRFAKWFSEPIPEHVRLLTVFLDFRLIYGDEEIFTQFVDYLYNRTTNQTIRFLAYDATLSEPPIGIFGLKHAEQGIDIKRFGIYPIANGIRVMALDSHLLHITNTRDRIEALHQEGFLGKEITNDLLEAYAFLQSLRLRHQAELLTKGISNGNIIKVNQLEKLDTLVLKESLKIVSSFQKNLKVRYGVDRGI
ncbi:MAG: DUF294 nucleotidyltransferase-like domain-containing protein [Syntrophobacterales bacterium]|nr:DUF294 nucleotidyltransferase-like domain-containing protein [Syntrophobacterales bacterium]